MSFLIFLEIQAVSFLIFRKSQAEFLIAGFFVRRCDPVANILVTLEHFFVCEQNKFYVVANKAYFSRCQIQSSLVIHIGYVARNIIEISSVARNQTRS